MRTDDKELKEAAKKELDKLTEARTEFYEYLDTHIPKAGEQFDFSGDPCLNAKDIYTLFYKLDYQSRKLRPYLVKAYNLKSE